MVVGGRSLVLETAHRPRPRIAVTLLLLVSLGFVSAGQETVPAPPRLLVLLVVDQMRADYVESYGDQWTAGLRRLFDDGAWFKNAAYPYRSTVTCAGHATISTGRFPSAHGMIQNTWWERATARRTTCTTDDSATPLSYGAPAGERHSPRTLLQPTVGDLLRHHSGGESTVVSLSLKPRSAITLAGQQGDSVVWLDEAHTWATSTAFADAPVSAVSEYVEHHPIEADIDRVWTRALPIDRYRHGDDGRGERPPPGWTTSFPHRLNVGSGADDSFFSKWRSSPLSDAYLTDMAIAMVDAFEMGSDPTTDYLAIGLSALDLVGHQFGPNSHEVQDVLAHLDITLGRLLAALDTRLGHDGYVVALSSDHGVAPIPEGLLDAGVEVPGRFQNTELLTALETLLRDRLGREHSVSALVSGDLYFAPGVYSALQSQPAVLEEAIRLIRMTPGVAHVYRSDELEVRATAGDPMARAATLSYLEGRSGDVIIILKPGWIPTGLAATHGSPYDYDTKVPVVLFGAGIRQGVHMMPTTPADVAPTLATLAGLSMPEADGRILTEALLKDR